MRIFALNRLAYFDELAKDPDVAKVIDFSNISDRFIGDLESPKNNSWNTISVSRIPELESINEGHSIIPTTGKYVRWGRVRQSSGHIVITNMDGENTNLVVEAPERIAIWDTKTKRLLFIEKVFVQKFSDTNYKRNFFEALAKALDSNSDRVKL